jgi:hypothetical protein
MKIKGPFMKVMLMNEIIMRPLLKPKFKIRTCNDSIYISYIHINDQTQLVMINMPLKWHHIDKHKSKL